VPSLGYSFRPFRCAFSVFVRGNDEQQAQRCADSVHVNRGPGGLRPAAGYRTLLRSGLPRRRPRPQRPVQTRRSPQSAKCVRACFCANHVCIHASQHRSAQRTSANYIRASDTTRNGASGQRTACQRTNGRRATDTSAGSQPRSEILAAAFDRRILRAPDPAPQFRREIRRLRLSRSGLSVLLHVLSRVVRFMRRDHFLRNFIRHIIVM